MTALAPVNGPEAVRYWMTAAASTRLVSMFDLEVVASFCEAMGDPEAAVWMREDPRRYIVAVLMGFQTDSN